jgi:transcriptional regulator with XRE-family HTH domain
MRKILCIKMKKNSIQYPIAESLGKLIKHQRAQTMDQTELALRTGLSRNTISAIENGKSVNSEALFMVLAHLQLLHLFEDQIALQLSMIDTQQQRKARKPKTELSNDF